MKKRMHLIPIGFLSYILMMSITGPFIASTTLDSTRQMTLFVLFSIVAMVFIRFALILYPTLIILSVSFYNSVFNKGGQFSLLWLQNFFKKRIWTSTRDLMTNELAYVLFTIFILINLILIIRKKRWVVPFLLMLAYLMALIGINQSVITLEISIFLFTFFCLAYYLNHQDDLQGIPTLISIVVLALISTAAQSFPHYFYTIHASLQTHSRPLRKELSQRGFYEIQKIGEATGIKGRAGFSEQDDVLGGPLVQSDSVVFEVLQATKHNWRIETKEVYTGKGWLSQQNDEIPFVPPQALLSDAIHYKANSETVQFLNSREGIRYLPIPQGKVSVETERAIDLWNPTYSPLTQRIRLNGLSEDGLQEVRYQVNSQAYTLEDLKQSQSISDPRNELDYLQLPENFSEEVAKLARAIVEDETNDYLKVKRIENYLSKREAPGSMVNPILRYSTSDAKYTPSDRDFVEFFLFDSGVGYCEHYSSAMVVMLRSLGIHTRWVKGYSAGTLVQNGAMKTYRITDNDAHAWPEVYFENVGWVAFEPTPGFTDPFSAAERNPSEEEETNSPNPQTPQERPEEKEETLVEDHLPVVTKPINTPSKLSKFIKDNTPKIIGFFLFLSALAYYFRKRISFYLWFYRLKRSKSPSFSETYASLLKHLNLIVPRDKAMSIQEYLRVCKATLSHDLRNFDDLSRQYEAIIYGAQNDFLIETAQLEAFVDMAVMIKNHR